MKSAVFTTLFIYVAGGKGTPTAPFPSKRPIGTTSIRIGFARMKSVLGSVEALFEEQIAHWPLLAQGIEGLARAQTRQVHVGRYDIVLRHIPHRVSSSTARIDKASIEKRPCFLCD